jgi:hypothetical protein
LLSQLNPRVRPKQESQKLQKYQHQSQRSQKYQRQVKKLSHKKSQSLMLSRRRKFFQEKLQMMMKMRMMVNQLILPQLRYQEVKLKLPKKLLKIPLLPIMLELNWSRPDPALNMN